MNKTPVYWPLFPGQPEYAGTRKVEPVWILMKQEMIDRVALASPGSYVSHLHLAADRKATPAPHHSIFYSLYALSDAQPTV